MAYSSDADGTGRWRSGTRAMEEIAEDMDVVGGRSRSSDVDVASVSHERICAASVRQFPASSSVAGSLSRFASAPSRPLFKCYAVRNKIGTTEVPP
jgi:hypothetical protein